MPNTGSASNLEPPLLDHGGPVDRPYEPFPRSALDGSICDRFDGVALRHASRPAVSDRSRSFSYRELATLVNAIAGATVAATAHRPGPVAVLLPHEARFPAALLGVLAAGRGCVPLDANHPIERNRLIAAHAGAAAVIAAGDVAGRARRLFARDLPVLDIDALVAGPSAGAIRRPGPDDLACILYTSGSTGTPKGVYQNHRGVLHDVMQFVDTAHLDCDDRQALFYSPSVIAGFRVAISVLLTGASIRILSPAELGPAELVREVRAHHLTLWNSSPALFRRAAETQGPDERMDSLRQVLLGGDRVDWTDYDLVRRCCGPSTLVRVHLGATECWTVHTQWYVDESVRDGSPRLPVGHAVPERPVKIVGEDGNEAADGETGECVVSSRHLALGYWRDPELTARAFTADPADPAMRSFRTGDLALRRPDGLLEFIGRKDHQIKLAGRRIEPAEIEIALKQCHGVRDAAILVRRTAAGLPRSLVAWVELRPGFGGLLPRHLMAMLTPRLPRHMLPSAIHLIDRLPLLPAFKVDRARLAALDRRGAARAAAGERSPMEEAVMKAVEDVLEITGSTPDDSLASLGADSLQAIGVASELERRFGIVVPPDAFELTRPICDLSHWIAMEQRRSTTTAPSSAGKSGVADWAAAVDRLLNEGDLDAARDRAQDLHAARPGLEYGKNLKETFDRLPASDASQAPFTDEPGKQVQIVRREGADTVILFFCGIQGALGIPLPAMHRWVGRLPATIVYLRDPLRAHYFGGLPLFGADRASSIAGLRDLAARLGGRRILCWGNSAGTVAALHYGLDLGAEAVAALGGPINFSAEFNVHLRSARLTARMRKEYPAEMADVRRLYADARRPPRALLVYGDNSWDDRLHAEHLGGLPSVTLLALQDCRNHNVVVDVIKRGWIGKLLDWMIEPEHAGLPGAIPATRAENLV